METNITISVPVWEKCLLTIDEASAYFGLGTAKIRELSDSKDCDFVLWNGKKRLIKRKKFENYLTEIYTV